MTAQFTTKARRSLEEDRQEKALLDAVASGDREAFDQLYRLYYPRLSDFLARMLAESGYTDEVINDTMYVIWTKANTFRGQSRLSTWIFGIAYKKALKLLEREGRFRFEQMPEDWDAVIGSDSAINSASEMQLRDTLTKAVAKLSPAQRSVIELTYEYGYSYAEIAEIVGCPENTVKTRMFHARGHLRKILETLARWER